MNQGTGTKAAPTTKTSKEIAENEPTTEQIRQRAYEIYLSRGDGPGDDLQDWLQAERNLRSERDLTRSFLKNAQA
jgi:hypothetical protein